MAKFDVVVWIKHLLAFWCNTQLSELPSLLFFRSLCLSSERSGPPETRPLVEVIAKGLDPPVPSGDQLPVLKRRRGT